MIITKSTLVDIGIYFQFVQLSLLQVPRDEIDEFIDFFQSRILPKDFLSMHSKFSDGVVEPSTQIDSYKQWVSLEGHPDVEQLNSVKSNFFKISKSKYALRSISSYFRHEFELPMPEMSQINFIFSELNEFFKNPNQSALTRLQNLRTVILNILDQVILPYLDWKNRQKVLSRIEHFAMNDIHDGIDVRDVINISNQ